MSKFKQSHAHELVLEQAVLGVWCTLLTCDCSMKDSLCVLNLTTKASYTAIFLLFSLAITKHLEVAGGDFQDLVCAACKVRALPSWFGALVSFSSPSPLLFLSQALSAMLPIHLQLSPRIPWPLQLLLALSDVFPPTCLLFSDLLLLQRCIPANLEMNRPWKNTFQKFMQ